MSLFAPYGFYQQQIVAATPLSPVIDGSTAIFLDTTDSTSYPGSGNTWYDLSGNGNNADVSLVTSYWNANGYFDWPGTDYTKVANVADAASLDVLSGDFTVQIVGTVDASAGGASDVTSPFGKENWFQGFGCLIIRNSSDANYRKVYLRYNDDTLALSTGTVFTNLGDWFVLQFVRSGSTTTYYRNLTNIGTKTSSANLDNNNTLRIGRGRNDVNFNYKWDGKIANIAWYSKALSSAERTQNYNYFKSQLGF